MRQRNVLIHRARLGDVLSQIEKLGGVALEAHRLDLSVPWVRCLLTEEQEAAVKQIYGVHAVEPHVLFVLPLNNGGEFREVDVSNV